MVLPCSIQLLAAANRDCPHRREKERSLADVHPSRYYLLPDVHKLWIPSNQSRQYDLVFDGCSRRFPCGMSILLTYRHIV